MKKIIIVSYSFPPCNLTAAQRALSWFDHLNAHGFYPIIITRNWDIKIETPIDAYKVTGEKILKVKTEKGEIHYLPYKSNLSGRLYSKYGNRFLLFRKSLTFMELVLQPYFLFAISFRNIFTYTINLVKNDPEIKAAIVTANPFILFKLGYTLNKKFGTKWIADYRDDWTTDELKKNRSFLETLIHKQDKHFEKKWVSSASCFTTISEYYKNKISGIIPVDGQLIFNGYNSNDFKETAEVKSYNKFTILYNGTLYNTQRIEIFLDAYNKLRSIEKYRAVLNLKFIGLGYNKDQVKRVTNLLGNNLETVDITNRISRGEILEIQSKSHLLLMVGHNNIKGVASSKIYEYLSLRKPILLCEGDGDILEKLVRITDKNYICNTSDEVYHVLKDLCDKFIQGEESFFKSDLSKDFEFYSREHQVKQLAEVINKVVN